MKQNEDKKGIEAGASGDPNVKISINADGNASIKLKNRHIDDGHARMWMCINCHTIITLYSRVDEFQCPTCGYVTDLKLLRKLAEYELEMEKKKK